MITTSQITQVCPRINIDHVAALLKALESFKITTPVQQAAFLANCANETGGFTIFEENLNYSADRLVMDFPKYFPTEDMAIQYGRNPKAIGNRVYADRMGNGPESSGDGYNYRGRGDMQLTGRAAYQSLSVDTGIDFVNNPDSLIKPEHSAASAAWFWAKSGAGRYADAGDFDGVCDVVNRGHKTAAIGDSIGYVSRLRYFAQFKAAMGI